MMRHFAGFAAALVFAAAAGGAGAVTCAKGVYRAGCAGPNGAVVGTRPAAAPYHPAAVTTRTTVVTTPHTTVVAAPHATVVTTPQCRIVNGRRVCA